MSAPPLPLIPSTVVGSHGKPGWWYVAVKACEAGELGTGGPGGDARRRRRHRDP